MNTVTMAHIGTEMVVIGGIAFYFHRKTQQLQEENKKLSERVEELAGLVEAMQERLGQLIGQTDHIEAFLAAQNAARSAAQARPEPVTLLPQPPPSTLKFATGTGQPPRPTAPQTKARKPAETPPQTPAKKTAKAPVATSPPSTAPVATSPLAPWADPKALKQKKVPAKPVNNDDTDSGEETFEDEDLDKSLEQEMSQMKQERQPKRKPVLPMQTIVIIEEPGTVPTGRDSKIQEVDCDDDQCVLEE
jgi:hypothetical protein